MKKQFYLSLLIAGISITAHGQINKGATLIGGDLGINSTKNSPDTMAGNQVNINLSPSWGKAIKQNLVVGVELIYGHTHNSIIGENQYDQENDSYGGGLFVRKYKYLGSHFYLFGQGSLAGSYLSNQFTYSFQSVTQNSSTTKGYNLSLAFYPGVSYAINNRIQLETGFNNLINIGYAHSTTQVVNQGSPPEGYKTSNFSLTSSLSNFSGFVVGVRFLFNHA
jgi:hypothetical protein